MLLLFFRTSRLCQCFFKGMQIIGANTRKGEQNLEQSNKDVLSIRIVRNLYDQSGIHLILMKRLDPKLTCLGAGSLSQRYMNISRQRLTRSALITAFDSRARPRMTAENRSLETNSRRSTLFVNIARRTTVAEKEQSLVTASLSVHVNASNKICNTGIARLLCFKRKLQQEVTVEKT